ncbi:hypothetical protein FHG66_03965 [Rubellimicrobium rubrum]|uniref:HlyD family efflux transporter periplasmic adaptor subunit n=1 Tax=Rubellimicrobium rubrum TaxID=2585369 RepID=A0A5C4N5Q2_9RHOB|nr:hypothetical protein [Rubellimicrobium rubrum]TNC51969.1 hypothetical protein FHG66_03965 [Rubellimicrobium rubrum]
MCPAPEPRPAAPLFRPEAVAEQESRWLGQVLIVPRLGLSLGVAFAALLALGVLGLLVFGQYTRTERLAGWLVPAIAGASAGGQGTGVPLEARLHAPGHAIGDLRPGQRVQLRYDAFPYQRHGQHKGVVRRLLPASLTPEEVAEITGSPALAVSGPLFEVEVDLVDPAAEVMGQGARLMPTMTLEADVLIETRKVWEWVLDLDDALDGESEGEGLT